MFVDVEKAKDGALVVKVKKNNREYYLSSKYYPLDESKKLVKNLNFQNQTILIIGAGNPYLINEIKKLHSDKRVFIIEPFEEIVEKLEELNLIPKFEIKIIKTESELKELLLGLSYFDYYIHPQYKNLIDNIQSWEGLIKSTLHNLAINRNTLIKFGRVWAKNFILSFREITSSKGINLLFNKFKNSNAIVVGAGPSLDEHVKVIQEIYDECLVISVDTSFSYLVNNRITPDFVISVDPQIRNFIYLLKNREYENTIFVCDTLYVPLIYEFIPRENIFLFDSPFKVWQRVKERGFEKGELMVGGSVVCSAIDLANKLGALDIILAGNDLSYPEKRIYSKENFYELNFFVNSDLFSPYDQWQVLSKYPLLKRYDSRGKVLLTDPRMIVFKEWIEEYIRSNKVNIINLSVLGLPIEGTKPFDYYSRRSLKRKEINEIKSSLISLPLGKALKMDELESVISKLSRSLLVGDVANAIKIIEDNLLLKDLLELSMQRTLLGSYTEEEFIDALKEEVKYLEKTLKMVNV